jgi:hypothetical protein
MAEERESRRVWWITGAVLLALVAWRFLPEVENPLAPEPVAAYVALLADGEPAAADGAHRLAAGRKFRLYAVLEARDWRGETIWFSEAPALRLGGREIPAAAIRRWPGEPIVRLLWLSVEGFAPYLEIASAADLDRFHFEEAFHAEWGRGWSVDGVVDPRAASLPASSPLRPLPFGTQRYAVRIERYADEQALTPQARWSSPGAEAAAADAAAGTSLVAALPAPLAAVSAAVGRTQLDPAAGLPAPVENRLQALHDRGAAVVGARLWAEHLAQAGTSVEALAWREVDVAGRALAWERDVSPGDVLQAGDRLVVLFRDAGEPGALDPADLAFDAARGLRLLRLDEIFAGEGGLDLELARLPRGGG